MLKPFIVVALIAGMTNGACLTAMSHEAEHYPALPEPVTSFGAVVMDGYLYAFGGHKGERHDYNAEMVSGSFYRLRLAGGKEWEPLPGSTPGQGQPLVAYKHRVYRIGGMAARNHQGQSQDLFSTNLVERFDPRAGKWEGFAVLPEPRSSHDATILDGKIFVAGGWNLSGGTNKPAWPDDGLVCDLNETKPQWRAFPQPFKRRALALAGYDHRVFCLGGMNSDNEPTLSVDVYDPRTKTWVAGPSLPAGKFKGFSCSAITQSGHLFANTFQGDILCYAEQENCWQKAGRVEHPRLAHRLVGGGSHQLIVLGGEDGEEKRPDLELIIPSIKKGPVTDTRRAAAAQP